VPARLASESVAGRPKINLFTTSPFDHSTTYILRCDRRGWEFVRNDRATIV